MASGRADVWYADLGAHNERLPEYRSLLGSEEIQRADKFHFEKDRARFIVSHGILRLLLSDYLKVSPAGIAYHYSAYGKPTLPAQIAFNMSHSGERGIFAFTIPASDRIGVDIEQARPIDDAEKIVQRFFSPAEVAEFRALPTDESTACFYRAWTRKEAFIKALGDGLSYPLQAFDVSIKAAEPARLLRVRSDPHAVEKWTLADVSREPDYIAALAVENRNVTINMLSFGA